MSDQLEPQPPSHAPALEPAPPVADPAKHATAPGKKSTLPKHINGQALVPAVVAPSTRDNHVRGKDLDYVNNGAYCEQAGHAEHCRLETDTRTRLIQELNKRISFSFINYMQALTDVGIDELLQKQSDNSWVMVLILDVVTLGLGSAMMRSARNVGVASAISEAVSPRLGTTLTSGEFAQALLGVSKTPLLGEVVKTAVNAGKAKIVSLVKPADAKSTTLAYITALKDAAGGTFQEIGSTLCTSGDDDVLELANATFHKDLQTYSGWRALLETAIATFKTCGLTELGQRMHGGLQQQVLTRSLRWVKRADGRRLEFFEHGFQRSSAMTQYPSPPKEIKPHVVGQPVAVELQEVAVAMHRSILGTEPEEYTPQ